MSIRHLKRRIRTNAAAVAAKLPAAEGRKLFDVKSEKRKGTIVVEVTPK